MRLTPEEIYLYARHAGFSPDQAVTMTAIALAESGGDPNALNTAGEHSVGLWQVNLAAHPHFADLDATDPLTNARMAFELSGRAADIGRWTVAHADRGARYLDYREQAEAASRAVGEHGIGQWNPPDNYYSPKVSAGAPADIAPPLLPGGGAETSDPLDRFLDAALSQVGDPYIFGAEVDLDDPDPDAYDCSELSQWAAAQAGVDLQDGSYNQYLQLRGQGAELTVEEALQTPGALVFTFSSEPLPGHGRPAEAHVAISLGNGQLVEARGERYGVAVADAEGRGFTHAAYIPALGTEHTAEVMTGELAYLVDSDGDGLLDAYERLIGTDPFAADTDRDGFPDDVEIVAHRTDPLDFAHNALHPVTGLGPVYRPPLTTDLRPADAGPPVSEPADPLRPGRSGETRTSPDRSDEPPERPADRAPDAETGERGAEGPEPAQEQESTPESEPDTGESEQPADDSGADEDELIRRPAEDVVIDEDVDLLAPAREIGVDIPAAGGADEADIS